LGPCRKACKHRDCAESRFIAGCLCNLCGKRIGFGTRFYLDRVSEASPDNKRWVHADCFEDAIEAARRAAPCQCGYCEACLVHWANDPAGGGAL